MKRISAKLFSPIAAMIISFTSSAKPVFVETEAFENLGGWSIDSQFIDLMGSSYLLAHGLGKPVEDASTRVDIDKAGKYFVFAKTRNWVAYWSNVKDAPGRFEVIVNDTVLDGKAATVLGTGNADWEWYFAGEVVLPEEKADIRLHDLTGFDGRCDAVAIVPESFVMKNGGIGNANKFCEAIRPEPVLAETKDTELVVVGGGIAGVCTAVSAARLGMKVALIQDRPVLGGCNSSEVRVHLGGYQNLPPYTHLGDVVAEIGPAKGGNARHAANYEDERKLAVVAAEKNITLHLNTRVISVEMNGSSIKSVTGRNVVDGREIRFTAPLFVDCTGDGVVGALAGADFRQGREGKAETGEEMAPEKGDKMTMGASVQWYTRDCGKPVSFPAEPWMIQFNEENCEYGTRGDWDWETGMMRDQITEFERIRDYGMLVVYSNWSFIKNKSAKKAKYANLEFDWVAYVAGKRESRRLLGDHIMTQQDIFDYVKYEDGTCMTTWAIDLHYPMPSNMKNYPGEPFRSICTHNVHYAYPIPYRCLYSRNVDNLFMAGRNISVTHVALGTVRVMRTTGMMGEVVGMAASICKANNCKPRKVYQSYLPELKALMSKGVGDGKKHPPQNYNLGALKHGNPPKTKLPSKSE